MQDQTKKLCLFLIPFALASFSPSVHAAHNRCEKVFGDEVVKPAPVMKPVWMEEALLRALLENVLRGNKQLNALEATPLDRNVQFEFAQAGGVSRFQGRITGAKFGAGFKPELVALDRDDKGNYVSRERSIPLASVNLGSLRFAKIGAEEPTSTMPPQAAQQAKPRRGATKRMPPAQTAFIGRIRVAAEATNDISFVLKGQRERFEGRVLKVLRAGDDHFVLTYRDRCEEGCGYRLFKASEIDQESFNDRAVVARKPLDGKARGQGQPELTVFFEHPQSIDKQRIFLSESLLAELAALSESRLADPTQESPSRLPRDLELMVQPGAELRLYFTSGTLTFRLTIRRGFDGTWAFGDTTYDRTGVNEFGNRLLKINYTPNEEADLNHALPADGPRAVAQLRKHLSIIRTRLMADVVKRELEPIQKEWTKAVPEDIRSAEVVEMMLKELGLQFELHRGLGLDHTAALSRAEARTLAAIRYLVRNKLMLAFTNVPGAGLKLGVHAQGTVSSSGQVMMGYSFRERIEQAMVDRGLNYSRGEWRE